MAKRVRARCAVCVGVFLALLVATAPAAAAKKPITGKLSKRGYTVIALAENGKAKAVRTKPRKFKVRPPAKAVTLHLRAKDGTYAGPIVVGKKKKGKRALLGVKAGAKLGKVKVKARKGYAKVKQKLAKEFVDATRKARAKKGVPIGAGKFGRVRSKNTKGGAPGDRDLDGIADPLDIDDDGDLILDILDSSNAARASQGANEIFDLFTGLPLSLEYTANANAPGSTDQQIESALPSSGSLLMEIIPGDSSELDCGGSPNPSPPPPLLGGLVYCSRGGTGRVFQPGVPPTDAPYFPDCCDPDNDGFGTLQPVSGGPGPAMFLRHGATTAQIGTGDVLIQRVTTGGVESQFPAALQFVFSTVPALVSYSDTAGHSATVPYPVTPGPPPTPGGPGTQGNGFPVAGPGGDVVVTLTFWRPQRRPIPPETGDWIDIGGLTYETIFQHVGPLPGGITVQKPCPQSAYSSTDPQLGPPPPLVPDPGLTDRATDRPASSTNTLTFTVNLTQCLTSLGVPWNSGEEASIDFLARVSRPDAPDGAIQNVWFERQ
ncbi:MAG: hypothetical protein AABM29_02370 [Actinomycetota bacterium]